MNISIKDIGAKLVCESTCVLCIDLYVHKDTAKNKLYALVIASISLPVKTVIELLEIDGQVTNAYLEVPSLQLIACSCHQIICMQRCHKIYE